MFIGRTVRRLQAVVGNVFTSVHDMETLAHQELRLMNTIRDYINTQRETLRLLSMKLEAISKFWLQEQSVESIIKDPISSYSLVRRLTKEWPLMLSLLIQNIDTHLQEELSRLPTQEVLDSAIRGLVRLQEIYKLNTTQLTTGQGRAHLSALDCFEVGKYVFEMENSNAAVFWFKSALERTKQDQTLEEDKVFLATFISDCKNGTRPGVNTKVLHYLSKYPTYTLDTESASLFRQALSSGCGNPNSLDEAYGVERAFSDSCRGIGLNQFSELRCFYIHHNNPRLLIAPFKMEEKNLDPPILMFHEVISDREIQEMMSAFGRVRKTWTVIVPSTKEHVHDSYRTCDVGWIDDDLSPLAARLHRRVGDMTDLDMAYSENDLVSSCGLAGEYKLHTDPVPEEGFPNTTQGFRLATLMFYLNDVEAGGYTVFPEVNVAVKPVKGSAVFWFNIDHRGERILKLLHGGCPVLRGSKQVLNKWIHEGGQTSDMFCPVDEKFPRSRYYLNSMK